MNNKAFFFFAIFTLAMVGCSKYDIIEPLYEKEQNIMPGSKADVCDDENDFAFVRLGMYEDIENYNVTITDMWIESDGDAILPDFGTNITSVDMISSSFTCPTFDVEGGKYHTVLIHENAVSLTIHFNALVTCADLSCPMTIEDAVYVIDASQTNWKKNNAYSYVITVNPELLGLRAITFNPTVSDFENVECN